ncbi:MAG: molybdopterin-dependent oxidoreductase [Ilumatobacter sp.]
MTSGLYDATEADAAPTHGEPLPPPASSTPDGGDQPSRDPRRWFVSDNNRPSIWRGIVLGLLATGAGLGVAELVVGLVRGSSSPVVPVGQEFIDVTPSWLKEWAIEQFGTNDKAVLVAGALVVVLGLGSIVGIFAVRGAKGAAYALSAAVGVMGAWAVALRPEPTLGKFMPTIVGTAVSISIIWWLAPRSQVTADGNRVLVGPDRRQFVQGAVGIGSIAAIAGGVGRLLQPRFEVDNDFVLPGQPSPSTVPGAAGDGPATTIADVVPVDVELDRAPPIDGAELGIDGIESFVVPNTDFYRIDTALTVPQVPADSWSLSISGLVDNPFSIDFDELLSRPQVERYITLSCVSNPVGGELVGNALWQGVLLKPLLEEAGLQTGAEQLVSRSIDGWTCGSPIESIMDGRDAMLAFGMNGEPLPAQHGFPVRIVVPGLFGYVSATKWVTDIALTRWDDFDAYWVPRGWSKRGPVKTMARIDTPRSGASRDGEVAIGGVAWAVHRGISAVQIRIDEGEWLDAELGAVPSADTWVQWVYRWDTSGITGSHTVEARALDGTGEPQPEEPRSVAPDGAQGYHRISIDVN